LARQPGPRHACSTTRDRTGRSIYRSVAAIAEARHESSCFGNWPLLLHKLRGPAILSRILGAGSSTTANPGRQITTTTRFSATPSKNFSDGTASPSNTKETSSGGGGNLKLIAPAANVLRTRSRGSVGTIHVLAAAERNSKNAASLWCGLVNHSGGCAAGSGASCSWLTSDSSSGPRPYGYQ